MDLLTNNHGLSWIALKIFKYLSQKDVFNCRKVCKIWKHLIDTDMFWLRLHIDNIYQVIKKSEVYTKYMYLANHTNAKGTPFKVMEIFPDLKDLFDKALNQNRKVTEELIPQLKYYHKKTAVINHRFQHPVHYAAQNGDIELMKLLHDQCQADCNVKDRLRKCIPIHMACHYSHLQMVDYLLEHLTNKVYFKSTFIIACEQPNIQILEKLVEYAKDKCIKIDARNIDGQKALHATTKAHYIHHVELLLEHFEELGLNVNETDLSLHGNTAFHYACSGPLDLVKLFVNQAGRKGINLNATNAFNRTGFIIACQEGSLEVVNYLLSQSSELNIDLNVVDDGGKTGFMYACQAINKVQKVNAFIKHSKSIQIDNRQHKVLSVPMSEEDLAMLIILLHNSKALNINVNAVDHAGDTHLHWTLKHLHGLNFMLDNADATACLFLYHPDIDLDIRNNDGQTPLDLVKGVGNVTLVDLITQRLQEKELEGPSNAKSPKLN